MARVERQADPFIIRPRLKRNVRYDIPFQGDINLRQKVQGAGLREKP